MSRFAEDNYQAQLKRNRWITTLIFILILFFGSLFALRGNSGSVTAQVNDTLLGVVGTYGDPTFVSLDEIEQLQLTETMDFGAQVDGETKDNTMSGVYHNEEFGDYTLHVYHEKAPYIIVKYNGGNILVFNLGRASLTNEMYEDLQNAAD